MVAASTVRQTTVATSSEHTRAPKRATRADCEAYPSPRAARSIASPCDAARYHPNTSPQSRHVTRCSGLRTTRAASPSPRGDDASSSWLRPGSRPFRTIRARPSRRLPNPCRTPPTRRVAGPSPRKGHGIVHSVPAPSLGLVSLAYTIKRDITLSGGSPDQTGADLIPASCKRCAASWTCGIVLQGNSSPLGRMITRLTTSPVGRGALLCTLTSKASRRAIGRAKSCCPRSSLPVEPHTTRERPS